MNRFKTTISCLFAIGLLNNSNGQEVVKINQEILPSLNSTSHVFQLSYDILKDTLVPLFSFNMQIDNPILNRVFHHPAPNHSDDVHEWRNTYFYAETAKKKSVSYFSSKYFEKANTDSDILIWNSEPWLSAVYSANGKSLPYRASFALKLKSIDQNHTQLTIEAQSPYVLHNYSTWDECNCGIFPEKTTKVKATTIEEHTILQYVADKLRDTTVEPLKIPEPLFKQKKSIVMLKIIEKNSLRLGN